MEKEEFTYEEIDENVIYYVDKYIKRMISNTKISYLRKDKCSSLPDSNLIYLMEAGYTFPYYDEKIFMMENTTYLIGGREVIIEDNRIAECLDKLSECEREVLLKSVVLKIPLDEIADTYNVSVRMIKYYKKEHWKK